VCCLSAVVVFIGARFGALLWWIVDSDRWSAAFESFLIGFIGWILVPWVTLAWVLVYPGGVNGFDWVILILAGLFDLSSYASGGYSRRSRYA
jgi:hypothetical protein